MKKQNINAPEGREMHLTRPPRLEGVVKNAGIKPVRKEKKA